MKRYATLLLTALCMALSMGAAAQGHAAPQEPCYSCPPAPACDGCYTAVVADTEAPCLGCPPCVQVAPCLGCPPAVDATVYAVPTYLHLPASPVSGERTPCLLCPPATGQPLTVRSTPI